MHQLGKGRLGNLIDDHECQGARRPGFAGSREQARFAEIVARRQAAQLDVLRVMVSASAAFSSSVRDMNTGTASTSRSAVPLGDAAGT